MSTLSQLAQAITDQEGYYPGTRAYTNNNPGNLRPGNGVIMWAGQTGTDPAGFATFSTSTAGQQALLTNLQAHITAHPNQTLQQYIAQYAPTADRNNPNSYARAVASALGISTDTPLSEFLNGTRAAPGVIAGPASTPTTDSPFYVADLAPSPVWLGILGAALGVMLILD